MFLGRKFVLKHHFDSHPEPEAYSPRWGYPIPSIVLVDPDKRNYTVWMTPPFTMIGGAVGVEEQSMDPEFPVGCNIIHMGGLVRGGWLTLRRWLRPLAIAAINSGGIVWGYRKVTDVLPLCVLKS